MASLQSTYRSIFQAWFGDLPIPCFFCDQFVTKWGRSTWNGHIHHVDGDHSNDSPFNLAVAHVGCHVRHHSTGRETSVESNEQRSKTLRKRTVCSDCGVEYAPAWMTRHVKVGKCVNPTDEQLAEAAKLSEANAEMARRQWAEGKAGTYERTPEIRAKTSESLTGFKQSDESNRKRSESLKRAYSEGRRTDLSGKPRGKENWNSEDHESSRPNGSAPSLP